MTRLLCQALIDGKASPYHPLCGSTSAYVAQSNVHSRVATDDPGCRYRYMHRYTVGASVGGRPITITPLEPVGCRYLEVHASRTRQPRRHPLAPTTPHPSWRLQVHVVLDHGIDPSSPVSLDSVTALFRGYGAYQGAGSGSWACPSDALLERVWRCGVTSTSACVEDSPIDGSLSRDSNPPCGVPMHRIART